MPFGIAVFSFLWYTTYIIQVGGRNPMIEIITLINSKLNNFVWGVPAMVLILGVGL